ncbi:glycoside hydrolase superfamily [Parachaetomium inaequale]|uniref:Glycoside hydrolase superfamily n=1 Tax=Parachaetomium inaequale TaxID=2588326 RepID=A0AAN6PI74_9PEZI|nr:glycoside hydrolase superfamily [Parachaetomium inaequale]
MTLSRVLFLAATAGHASSLRCRAPTEAVPLDKQLMGLSIEFGNAVDFFGDVGKPNEFSNNFSKTLLIAPKFRQFSTLECVVLNDPDDPKGSEAQSVIFNARLFDVLTDNVPTGSPIIFGLNYRNNSLALAQQEIRAAYDHMDQSLIIAYELGNEANLYGPYRPTNYGVDDYAHDMREWIPSLRCQLPSANAKFQSPSFAGPELVINGMSIARLVELGVPQALPEVEYFSIHGYPYNICSANDAKKVDLRNFLNHTKTRTLIGEYGSEIAAVKRFGKKMHMGETGSVACHGKNGVSNTLGAALWELDYALTGTVAGINRFFFHMGQGDFYYSMWEPVGTAATPGPHINPTYYAMLFIADLVADLKDPKVAPMPDLDTDTTVHYAIYDGKKLQKLVLLNLEYCSGTSQSSRRSTTYGSARLLGKKLRVRRLTGANSAATTGVTWAGQSVDGNGSIIGAVKTESVDDGRVSLFASEAVIVERA